MSDFDNVNLNSREFDGNKQTRRGIDSNNMSDNTNTYGDDRAGTNVFGTPGDRTFEDNNTTTTGSTGNNMSSGSGMYTDNSSGTGGTRQMAGTNGDGFNGDSNFGRQGAFDENPNHEMGGTTRHAAHHGHEGGFDDSTTRNTGSGVAGGYGDNNSMGRTTAGEQERGYGGNSTTGGDNLGSSGNYGSNNYDDNNLDTYGANDDNYGSGNQRDQNNQSKPSMGQKIKGTADEVIGKMTKNPAKQEEGRQLKSGGNVNNA